MDRFDVDEVSQNLRRALEALKKVAASKKGRRNLFAEQESSVHIQLILKKVPHGFPIKIIRIPVPCSFHPEKTTSVCLFTKDVDRKWDHDVDRDSRYFKDLLSFEKGVTNLDQVISLQQLKREYKTYESKRKLCSAYDVFLVDQRIVPFVNRHLGNKFYATKKIPVPIDIQAKNVKNRIKSALATTSLTVKETSTRCSVKLGMLSQPVDSLLKNFESVAKLVGEKLPGGWPNIRTLYVEGDPNEDLPKLPIFASFSSVNDVRLRPPLRKVKEPVVGELSTLDDKFADCEVKVYSDGRVTLLHKDGYELNVPDDRNEIKAENSTKTRLKRKKRQLCKERANKKVKSEPEVKVEGL